MNTEKAWSDLFNALPIEKRREVIVYGIHDEIQMIEREKDDAKKRLQREIAAFDEQIAILRRFRDKVWDEMIKEGQV